MGHPVLQAQQAVQTLQPILVSSSLALFITTEDLEGCTPFLLIPCNLVRNGRGSWMKLLGCGRLYRNRIRCLRWRHLVRILSWCLRLLRIKEDRLGIMSMRLLAKSLALCLSVCLFRLWEFVVRLTWSTFSFLATADGRGLVAIGCAEGVWIGFRHDSRCECAQVMGICRFSYGS